MNDAHKSQGISTSTAQAVLSSHQQNTRTLLITEVLQDLVICMETETVYLIIHLGKETVDFNRLCIHNC